MSIPPVVTQLVIDASAAEDGVRKYEAVMKRAKDVTERTQKEISTPFDKAQRNWEQSLARTDPVIRAQIARERDLARQRKVNDDAVRLGIATQAQAAAQLERVRQKHQELIDAARGSTAANDNLAKAGQAASLALSRVGINVPVLTAGIGVIGAVGAALGIVAVSAVKAVDAYRRYEEEHLALNAVLQATGFSAGRTAEDIEKLAAEIGNVTEVRKAALELAQFRNIAGEVFDDTLRAADDLSAAGFGSISSAAAALGKALESPEQGLTRLRKAGIFFSEGQAQTITDMQQTGRIAEAQRYILDELRKRIGGVGAARDQGLAGSYEALSDATERLLTRWGKQITDGLQLTSIIKGIASAMDEATKRAKDEPFVRLKFIDTAIDNLRRNDGPVPNVRGADQAEVMRQEALNRLLAEREKVLRQVIDAQEDAEDAARGAYYRQQTAAIDDLNNRVAGSIAVLERETAALKKNAFERAVDIELRKLEIKPAGDGETMSDAERLVQRGVNTNMMTAAAEQAIDAIQRQITQLDIEAATYGMTAGAAIEYRVVQEALAKAKKDGTTIGEKYLEQLREEAALLGKKTGAADNAREIGRLLEQGANSFVSGMVQGKSAMDAILGTVQQISSEMASIGTKSLAKSLQGMLSGGGLTLDPTSLAIGAVGAGIGALLGQFEKQKQAEEEAARAAAEAQQAWRAMAQTFGEIFAPSPGTKERSAPRNPAAKHAANDNDGGDTNDRDQFRCSGAEPVAA